MIRSTNVARRLTSTCLATLLALQVCVPVAHADEPSIAQLEDQASQALVQIEEATQTYQDAQSEVASLSTQIAQNEQRSAELEAELPLQRERTADSIKNLYLFQQSTPGLLVLVLSSQSFNDFITTVRYIDAIQQHNTAQVEALVSLQDELAATQASLSAALDAATAKQDEAMAALDTVRQSREDLQAQIDELRAAQAQNATAAQAEALKVVEDAAQTASDAVSELPQTARQATEPATPAPTQASPSTPSEATPAPEQQEDTPQQTQETSDAATPETPATSDANSWAARIDAYLAGSPLAGYGSVFAEAAAAYGVDPRVSPAIAAVESSKGAVCFRSHNAWGWGNSGWSDWNTAIHAHVSGFARGYGSTVTLEGARKYCPPTYQTWYNLVWAEMNKI